MSIADGGHACPKYSYCPKGATVELKVPIGTMQETFGRGDLNEAIQSPPGFYTADNTAGQIDSSAGAADYIVTECPVGYYCPKGSTAAIPCPKGTFRNTVKGQDISQCGLCPAGTYCSSEGTNVPDDCILGHFCPEGSINPQKCPIGTYNDVLGLMDSRGCTPCTAGQYCPFMG